MPSIRKASLIFLSVTIVLLSACGGSPSESLNNQAAEQISDKQQKNNNWNEGNWNEIDWQ